MDYGDHMADLGKEHSGLAREVADFNTLENVLGWMQRRGLALETIGVVTQDEFTHDVVIPFDADGRHIVFGIT